RIRTIRRKDRFIQASFPKPMQMGMTSRAFFCPRYKYLLQLTRVGRCAPPRTMVMDVKGQDNIFRSRKQKSTASRAVIRGCPLKSVTEILKRTRRALKKR